jgi:two-component system sensor histidine kinase HydH
MPDNRQRKIKTIVAALALATLLYYLPPLTKTFLQELLTRFYYFPIFLGGLWFGLRGGVRTALVVTIICLPHVLLGSRHHGAFFYDQLLELCLFNVAGPVVGILADRERRQRTINRELQYLATLGETVASVAHEMKNMVIPIRGFLRRIRENHVLTDKGSSYLEIVERESAKLDKMTQDMLCFARQMPLQREETEVESLVEEVRQALHEEFREKGVRLICNCDGASRRVLLDRQRMCQALVNVIQNALDASPEGKDVRLCASRNGDSLRIVIEDQGTGIPAEHLERIFKPFFTTKPKGTGLGMAITRRIVKEHGGEILVESCQGAGTRVLLDFPDSNGKTSQP